MNWYWISLKHATFAIQLSADHKIIDAAPIAKWMVGKRLVEIYSYLKKHDAKVIAL